LEHCVGHSVWKRFVQHCVCDTGFQHSALGFCRNTALSISGVAHLFVALGLTVFVVCYRLQAGS